MATSKQSILESRRDQVFPVLEPFEIERIRRFGSVRSYRSGEVLAEAGKPIEGLTVVLSGTVRSPGVCHPVTANSSLSTDQDHSWESWPSYLVAHHLSTHGRKAR